MKSAFKIALVTVALLASPAIAKDVKETKETTVKETTTKTVKHRHHRKHVTKTENNGVVYGTGTRRYDHSTYLGYPIQGNGNPDEARQAARAVKQH